MNGTKSDPSMYTFDWAVDKLVTPVATGLVLAIFGLLAPGWIADRFRPPTCDAPEGLEQAKVDRNDVTGAAKPDDVFKRKGRVTYEPGNLVDGNTSTAWVEAESGLGLGSSVRLEFDEPVDVRLVCVVNGYAQSWDLYKRNSRARVLEVRTGQGKRFAMLADAGRPDRPAFYQQAAAAEGKTSYLTLTLDSAYAAQQDDVQTAAYSDTSISEVEVWVKP